MVISKRMAPLVEGSSAIRKLFEEGKALAKVVGKENVYDYSLGNPSVPAPEAVKASIIRNLEEKDPLYLHGYMSNSGYDEVRQAVADNLNRRFGSEYKGEDIIMTVGAASGINDILNLFLDPDDEVVAFAPFFGEYRNYTAMAGGVLKVVPADTETFQINIDALDAVITERTRLVIVNNPNNPTGVIYSGETLDRLQAALARAEERIGHPIYVISDEPYRELVYDGNVLPFMPDHIRNCLIVYSFSKSLSLPGERIGYVAVSPGMEAYEEVLAGLVVTNRIGSVNAPSLMQLVIMDCLEEKPRLEIYDSNRRMLYDKLTALGFECLKPQGAFYLFVKSPIEDYKAFIEEGKKEHILMVDASGFGCPGYVRLAYCVSPEMIRRSFPAFERLAEKMKERGNKA
jgi:aspartate aminotransferase